MSVSGWLIFSDNDSPAKHVGCMEAQNTLSLREMATSQSRHGSRIRLSPREMLVISEQVSRDFSPKYSSHFLGKKPSIKLAPQEMRSISEEISREFAVRASPQIPHSEIVLLPVDPDHLHAYWHLDEEQLRKEGSHPLTLRIYAMLEDQAVPGEKPNWFDLPIESGLNQFKVTVPAMMTGNYYSAAIGWRPTERHFASFACSETTYIPRTPFVESGKPTRLQQGRRFMHGNASGGGKRS